MQTLRQQAAEHISTVLQELPNDPDGAEEYIKYHYKDTIRLMERLMKEAEGQITVKPWGGKQDANKSA